MTEKQLYQKLQSILATVDAERYPEICCIVDSYLGDDCVYCEAQEIARELFDADCTKLLPPTVAELLIEINLEEIEKENFYSMTDLGSLYYTGRCGEQNYEKAVKYYTMAAKYGEQQAIENLGYCYYYGRTGEKDYEKAYHYFIKGALANRINSLYKIADMYKNGFYVEKDESQAFSIYARCYQMVKESDEDYLLADICLRMGDAYFYGIGVEQDYARALLFFQQAECAFYEKIKTGDCYGVKGLKSTIEKQDACRKALLKELPDYDWVRKDH